MEKTKSVNSMKESQNIDKTKVKMPSTETVKILR
jgi:hypothetical protein